MNGPGNLWMLCRPFVKSKLNPKECGICCNSSYTSKVIEVYGHTQNYLRCNNANCDQHTFNGAQFDPDWSLEAMQKEWKDSFINVLEVCLNGMKGQEESWNEKTSRYNSSLFKSANKFMGLEKNDQLGGLAEIFVHWWNDVQAYAEYYGFTFDDVGNVVRPPDDYVPKELEPTDKADWAEEVVELFEDEEDEA